MPTPPIDRDKLRVFVRQLDEEDRLSLLDRAIDLLAKTKLRKLIEDHVSPGDLRPDGGSSAGLLAAAQRFHEESLRGRYYQSFNVNSKNYMDKSGGTEAWIAECHRLLDLCVAASASAAGELAETRTAFELIFKLLAGIDELRVDIIFFADEHGAWQVGVDWREVMPAWFRCLAASAGPLEYAELVHEVICYYAPWESEDLLPAALAAANRDQAAALEALPAPSQSYSQPTFST